MSIRKRVLALAAAGAAALMLGGIATNHSRQADASPATQAAVGCVNSVDTSTIQFATATNGTLSSVNLAPNNVGVLSVATPNSIVTCGAVFEDAIAAVSGTADADPATIDGGTISFTVNSNFATIVGANTASAINNGTSVGIPCGNATLPTVGAATPTGGIESCQGAQLGVNVQGAAFAVSPAEACSAVPNCTVAVPSPSNAVQVALRPGATFSLIGAGAPVILITANYQRYPALGASATIASATTNVTVGVPTYASQLVPSPATISATAGAQASTLTMSLFHAATACQVLAGGVVLLTPQVANGLVVCGGAVTQIQQFVPGAESGVVTFTTSDGVLANTTLAQGGGQQILSEHCGAVPNTVPTILIPTLGISTTFALTSCQTATALLYGGGNVGTAVVVANFVGDFTGATAQATTQVQLAFNSTVSLTRGCNEVVTGPSVATAPVSGTVSGLVTNLVTPSSAVVSVWMFNNSTHAFQAGFFSTAGAPTDFSTVGAGQSLFICVNGTATFNNQ